MATKKSTKTSAKTASTTAKKTTVKKAVAAPAKKVHPVTKPAASLAASVRRGRTGAILRESVISGKTPAAALIAEFVGTFLLASIILATSAQPLIVLFALIAIIIAVGSVSGAHLNPALSIAAWLNRRITGVRTVAYVVVQLLGAMVAYLMMKWFFDQNNAGSELSMQTFYQATALTSGKEWTAFVGELLGAFVLGFGFASAIHKSDKMASAYTVAGALFVGLVISGAASILNPAVALAVQAFDFGSIMTFMVYIIATIIGATAGFALYRLIRSSDETASTK